MIQVEVEKDRRTVLARHFSHVKQLEDISNVNATDLPRGLRVFAGGFPCKETSIGAPHRAGLSGRRSGLFWTWLELAEAYCYLIEQSHPEFIVIENPPGLTHSNGGRDLATLIHTLRDMGYMGAGRVVDGGHLGSPFRRPRWLLVARRGTDAGFARRVLGLSGAGSQAPAQSPVRWTQGGPSAVGVAAGPVVWRKSARPRASLSKGGYETWVNDGTGNVLTGFDWGGPLRQTHLVADNGGLRTFVPEEWERGLGYAPGWTSSMSRSARGAALGDTFQTGMAYWLGRRFLRELNAPQP